MGREQQDEGGRDALQSWGTGLYEPAGTMAQGSLLSSSADSLVCTVALGPRSWPTLGERLIAGY